MKFFKCNRTIVLVVLLLVSHLALAGEISWKASGENGVIVAGKPEAVSAGLEMLQKGGNAIDAAASALLVLSVKAVGAFCIGGEVPVIIYDVRKNDVKVFSGQGAAPLDPEAIEWFLANGIPGSSIKAAAVPAVIDLLVTMLQKNGTMSFEEVASPVVRILDAGGTSWYIDTSDGDTVDTGCNWYADLAGTLRKLVDSERTAIGDRAEKLQAVSNRFYRGDIADALDVWYQDKGGFLRKKDLISHVTRIEEPLKINYRGYTVYKCGPWTQGPYLLQTLQLLKGFDLKSMGLLSSDYIHTIIESMKLALADRDAYYGDPFFSNIPIARLLSERYSDIRRQLIDPKKASHEIIPGDPYRMKARSSHPVPQTVQGGTTTLCVSDRWGNVVVATPSGLGSTAGSAGETGIIHGARLVSLNNWKGHPNCIEAGKRPRITLTPTLIMKNDKPVLAVSIAGGDLQDQVALQLLLDNIEFGMLPEEAVKVPRFATGHYTGSFGQDQPDIASLWLQAIISQEVVNELEKLGHQVKMRKGGIGGAAMLYIDSQSGQMYGAGSAAGSIE